MADGGLAAQAVGGLPVRTGHNVLDGCWRPGHGLCVIADGDAGTRTARLLHSPTTGAASAAAALRSDSEGMFRGALRCRWARGSQEAPRPLLAVLRERDVVVCEADGLRLSCLPGFPHTPPAGRPLDLAWHSGGAILAVSTRTGTELLDAASQTLLTRIPHGGRLLFTPRGRLLINANASGTLLCCEPQTSGGWHTGREILAGPELGTAVVSMCSLGSGNGEDLVVFCFEVPLRSFTHEGQDLFKGPPVSSGSDGGGLTSPAAEPEGRLGLETLRVVASPQDSAAGLLSRSLVFPRRSVEPPQAKVAVYNLDSTARKLQEAPIPGMLHPNFCLAGNNGEVLVGSTALSSLQVFGGTAEGDFARLRELSFPGPLKGAALLPFGLAVLCERKREDANPLPSFSVDSTVEAQLVVNASEGQDMADHTAATPPPAAGRIAMLPEATAGDGDGTAAPPSQEQWKATETLLLERIGRMEGVLSHRMSRLEAGLSQRIDRVESALQSLTALLMLKEQQRA